MATAEELLASAEACDDILTVDLATQTIIIPKSVTILGVESDDGVRHLHFRVPRHFCKTDLSEFKPRINYENAKGGEDFYEPKDVSITDDMIYFDWVIGRYAVTYRGNVEFNVCMRDLDNNAVVLREFNTTTATLPVLKGLETAEAVVVEYADAFEQLKLDILGTGDTLEQEIKSAGDEVLANISIAVNEYVAEHQEELTGPQGPQGIQGIQGEKGDTGEQGPQGIQGEKGDTGPQGIQGIQGEKGDKGDTGEKGDKGDTGPQGPQGPQGIQGIQGEKGDTGETGPQGEKGDTGAAFTYDMFTAEQLEALTGPQGPQGEKGDKGDTGEKGDKGDTGETGPQGIQGIQGEKGDTGETGPQGIQGNQGEKGESITSIVRTSGTGAAGTTDTYTITTDAGNTHTFQVYNGADGEGAGDMLKSIYDPQNKNTDIFEYADGLVEYAIQHMLDILNEEEPAT